MNDPQSEADVPSLAELVLFGYHEFRRRFGDVTRRAGRRFELREWEDGQEDARERILLYDVVVAETLLKARRRFGGKAPSVRDASAARAAYREWARGRPDAEIAETFFNSVIRRVLGTVGIDRSTEFVAEAVDPPGPSDGHPWRSIPLEGGFDHAIEAALQPLPFQAVWNDREERCRRAAALLRAAIGPDEEWRSGRLEVLRPVFFRNKAAYLVGRFVRGRDETRPLILALTHPQEGITLDAVLPTADEASVVFGFSRSYLHADVGAPRPVIDFLRSIMPLKRVDELYTALGFNRHGKTELFRALLEHLAEPGARFVKTPGTEGLVMCVFTLPGLNVVFKVIRDRFGHPKKTTRERVMRNYGLIFVRDRVGRLADAQQFEHLELPRDRFSDEVLDELLASASRTVSTDHGRVIFYDYDEVALLTDCVVRERPPAPYPEAELAADPHFHVGPDDIFPAEWRAFLGPAGPLRQDLHDAHPELFEAEWWRDMQRRQKSGRARSGALRRYWLSRSFFSPTSPSGLPGCRSASRRASARSGERSPRSVSR